MTHPIVGCIAAALPGILIAWINARLTAKAAVSGTTTLSLIPVLRMVLSVGYLVLVYLVSPYLPWERLWPLAGACVGLTLPMFFFTFRLLQKLGAAPKQSGTTAPAQEEPIEPSSTTNSNNAKGGDS